MEKSQNFTELSLRRALFLFVFALSAGFAVAGESPRNAGTPTATANNEAAKETVNSPDAVQALQSKIAEQQAQIDKLTRAVELLTNRLNGTPASTTTANPASAHDTSVGQVTSLVPVIPARAAGAADPGLTVVSAANPRPAPAQGDQEAASPLQFHIGTAAITPVGFMDFTSVWRDHVGGSGIGTNFAGIPYGNAVFQNNLSEFRLSMQNSRIGFRVDADVKGAHVIGYMESDYLGNNPGNVAVSSNSNTLRSRLYWVDVRRPKWEVLGGQTWSLITPGRSGISPLPGDLFFTQNIDVNYQLGLVWGRIPELRFVYHPSDKVAFAVALDSPEQYVGGSAGGGLITLPAALNTGTTYQGELNIGSNTLGVTNVAPDVIAKLAFDPSKRFHVELGGIERSFKVWNPSTSQSFTATGGGGFLNLNVEVFKGFRLLTNNFWSDGGGRYIFGQAPDLVARADGSISPVHSGSTVSGFEFTHKNSMIYAYYGGMYVQRNVAVDANGTSLIGYGYSGSPAGQNRAVQEGTFGVNQTVWKDPKWGAVNFMGQYSYLTRNPWSVAVGKPADATMNMVFFNLRYTLPGSAPTLGK
ncbi:MAG TPA: hypothetical protein VFM21_05465 [Terriglobia bacterium]|nr:hypothetical protein [Terriglobia bacterium]